MLLPCQDCRVLLDINPDREEALCDYCSRTREYWELRKQIDELRRQAPIAQNGQSDQV